jgi:hypothetical protein
MSADDNGVRKVEQSVLTLTYDHETHQVAIGGVPMPLSLAMMICGEGMRVLEEQRGVAAVRVLQQQAAEAARVQSILGGARGRG